VDPVALHVAICAIEKITMSSDGMLTRAEMARATESRVVSMPKRLNRRGSMVSSTPNASGSRRNASTTIDPKTITTVREMSVLANRNDTRPTTMNAATPRP